MSIAELFNKESTVRQLPLFSQLKAQEIELITERSSLVEYKKNQIIYHEGDPPDAFYCIVTGRVKIFNLDPMGTENLLEYLHRGKYFGIISLLTGEGHSVNAEVINDSLILKIQKEDFNLILNKIPKLAIDLSQMLSRRLKRKDIHTKTIFESTIISVYSSYKGAGRTVFATNLALSLKKETNKNVILIDVSSKGNEVKKTTPIIDLSNFSLEEERIQGAISKSDLNIDFLKTIYDSKSTLSPKGVATLLSFLTNDYHYIVLDLPFRMDEMVFKTLSQSDLIFLISSPDEIDLKATLKLIAELADLAKYKEDKIKIIINEHRFAEGVSHEERVRILKHQVFSTLPLFKSELPDRIILTQPDNKYSKVVRRISRQIGDCMVGLALGSGAAYGLAHIGVLKVIEEENIPIDVISGSSIGAVIACLWASGKTVQELEEFASQLKEKRFIFKMIDLTFPKTGFIRGYKLSKLLREYLGKKTFYDIKIPLKILACNVKSKQTVTIDSGSLVDAVMASCAMPGIFKPVRYKDELLLDGGVLNPLPTEILVKTGAKKIIAVNVIPSREDILKAYQETKRRKSKDVLETNILDYIFSSIEMMEYELARIEAQQADIILHPDIRGLNWLEFHRVGEFIKRGEEEIRRNLGRIKELMAES